MKRVCIIGASRKLGQYMVKHALARGYEVVGVGRERSADKLEAFMGRITVIPRAMNDPQVIRKAVAGCDGVLTTTPREPLRLCSTTHNPGRASFFRAAGISRGMARMRNRRVDFALFMVAALENEELVHEVPAIVGCQTPRRSLSKRGLGTAYRGLGVVARAQGKHQEALVLFR